MKSLAHVSLLWRILLSTSIAVTLLFGVTGWIVQDNATNATAASLDEEVRASFHAYEFGCGKMWPPAPGVGRSADGALG